MRGYLIVVLLLTVPLVGLALPRFIIGNGINQYEGDKRKLAEQALLQTDIFFAGEPTSLIITAERVTRVGECRQYPPDFEKPMFALSGEVRLHTHFGIPYGELRFQCQGTEIILCPQNTAECTQALVGWSNTVAEGSGSGTDSRHGFLTWEV